MKQTDCLGRGDVVFFRYHNFVEVHIHFIWFCYASVLFQVFHGKMELLYHMIMSSTELYSTHSFLFSETVVTRDLFCKGLDDKTIQVKQDWEMGHSWAMVSNYFLYLDLFFSISRSNSFTVQRAFDAFS